MARSPTGSQEVVWMLVGDHELLERTREIRREEKEAGPDRVGGCSPSSGMSESFGSSTSACVSSGT